MRQGNRTKLGGKDLCDQDWEVRQKKRKSKRNGGGEGSGKVEEKQGACSNRIAETER